MSSYLHIERTDPNTSTNPKHSLNIARAQDAAATHAGSTRTPSPKKAQPAPQADTVVRPQRADKSHSVLSRFGHGVLRTLHLEARPSVVPTAAAVAQPSLVSSTNASGSTGKGAQQRAPQHSPSPLFNPRLTAATAEATSGWNQELFLRLTRLFVKDAQAAEAVARNVEKRGRSNKSQQRETENLAEKHVVDEPGRLRGLRETIVKALNLRPIQQETMEVIERLAGQIENEYNAEKRFVAIAKNEQGEHGDKTRLDRATQAAGKHAAEVQELNGLLETVIKVNGTIGARDEILQEINENLDLRDKIAEATRDLGSIATAYRNACAKPGEVSRRQAARAEHELCKQTLANYAEEMRTRREILDLLVARRLKSSTRV